MGAAEQIGYASRGGVFLKILYEFNVVAIARPRSQPFDALMIADQPMSQRVIISVIFVCVIALAGFSGRHTPSIFAQQFTRQFSPEQRRAIQLSISSNPTFSDFSTRKAISVQSTFKRGEPVYISIVMTNTATELVRVCEFSEYQQDRPQLIRNGDVLAYLENVTEAVRSADNGTCEITWPPQILDLKPNIPFRIPAIKLQDWYRPLGPGHYTLFLKRTFACCADGQWNRSNTISFDVTSR
jgi:hypothetical protein